MSDTVIKVENLSKQYRIGAKEGYKTFRETLVDAAKAPFVHLGAAWRIEHGAKEKTPPCPLLSAPLPLLHKYHNVLLCWGLYWRKSGYLIL